MTDKKIEVLRKQIGLLHEKEFNLEAWKTSTKLLLERIFGSNSQKIKEIDKIHYDLSSWAMRDTLGTGSSLDSCKRTGRAILETCILELEALGDPLEGTKDSHLPVGVILSALEGELRMTQFRELSSILRGTEDHVKRTEGAIQFLEKLGCPETTRILASILSNREFTRMI